MNVVTAINTKTDKMIVVRLSVNQLMIDFSLLIFLPTNLTNETKLFI